jgi:hypothetical protein
MLRLLKKLIPMMKMMSYLNIRIYCYKLIKYIIIKNLRQIKRLINNNNI